MRFAFFVAIFTVLTMSSFGHAATKKTSGAHGKTSALKSGARRKGRSRRVRHSAGQLAPTPDRYKEIQQALADRGYLKAEPSGVWDAQSQDAMRAFQTDQKLEPSGKLTAAALIALGLGPKRDTPPVPAATPAPPQAQPAAPEQTETKPAAAVPAAVESQPAANTQAQTQQN
jgi:hypothetical protein